jgi:hypothetical protein
MAETAEWRTAVLQQEASCQKQKAQSSANGEKRKANGVSSANGGLFSLSELQ